jgi:hypothetical protein
MLLIALSAAVATLSIPDGLCDAWIMIMDESRDLSVISWARHIMRCKSHGNANEEEKANCSGQRARQE